MANDKTPPTEPTREELLQIIADAKLKEKALQEQLAAVGKRPAEVFPSYVLKGGKNKGKTIAIKAGVKYLRIPLIEVKRINASCTKEDVKLTPDSSTFICFSKQVSRCSPAMEYLAEINSGCIEYRNTAE